jgi:hypothetical protein
VRRPGFLRAFGCCIAGFAFGASCSSQTSPYDDVPWTCFEDQDSCECLGGTLAEGKTDPRTPATSCAAELDCCFVIDDGKGGYECRCIETPPDEPDSGGAGASGTGGEGEEGAGLSQAARCTRAATEHDTTEVVAHCPPVTLDSSTVCAQIFESCDPEYLKENGLVACCDGLVCQKDANGQIVCVEG